MTSAAERLALALAEARHHAGISQRELSERVRVMGHMLYPSAIGKIERGERRADVDDVVALAQALDVSLDQLLGWTRCTHRYACVHCGSPLR